jgi:hypothetical protein
MDDKQRLEAKGYAVGTRDLAMQWLCNLEWHGNVKSFFGSTEKQAISDAARYVESLEASYAQQQCRGLCKECGE